MTREEMLEEIDRERKWLDEAGYTAYNIDMVFSSLYKNIKSLEQEPKTISIPEGATNGDVFKIMFNKTFPKTIIVYKNDESRLTINPMFAREWWGMPYKESEG